MVQRRATRGPKRGGFFWGCSRYPACRETVDIPSIAATPDPIAAAASTAGLDAPTSDAGVLPGGAAVIGQAGGSARRTYERRREADDAQRTDRLRKAVSRVDAQTARGGRAGPTFHEAGGRGGHTIGAKRSILIEILGLPIAARVDPARPHDMKVGRELLADQLSALPGVQAIVADRATAAWLPWRPAST
jgi:hypothetical protein